MVFKRREKRSWLRIMVEFFYPRGGWTRAFHYMRHRVRRLPDPPHKIARGVFAGVFAAFTPFYGLHFIIAALLARVLQGNIIAALIGTFFGNPLTYIPIGVVSLKFGHFLLGTRLDHEVDDALSHVFLGAARDLLHNLFAVFTQQDAHWEKLTLFYEDVFLPYLVGGIVPGIVTGLVFYYLSVPLVTAYQKHRKARLAKKLDALRRKAAKKQIKDQPL